MSIIIKDLKKSFNEEIIKKFTYRFSDKGLYLLFGESGCGKTTLLNIIAGLSDFEEGSVSINGTVYENFVDNRKINVAYITQNTFFVDYLTVRDNIMLCCKDIELINQYAEKLNLLNILDCYPETLSGGEKQRVSFLINLLQKKEIFIMDEPTASLDRETKREIFSIINTIKENKLIICATHDEEMLQYADDIIKCNKLKEEYYADTDIDEEIVNNDESDKGKKDFGCLLRAIMKQNKYKKREKLSGVVIGFIIMFTLVVVYFCNGFDEKLNLSMINIYKVNAGIVIVSNDKNIDDYCDTTEYETVFSYNFNEEQTDAVEGMVCLDYEPIAGVLPNDKSRLPYADKIIYGEYPSNENEIIIGKDVASKKAAKLENLIGKKYSIKLIDGEHTFTISGIADFSDELSIMYFEVAENVNYPNGTVFLSADFMEKYKNSKELKKIIKENGEAAYVLFFDSNKESLEFMKKYKDDDNISVLDYSRNNIAYKFDMVNMAYQIYKLCCFLNNPVQKYYHHLCIFS